MLTFTNFGEYDQAEALALSVDGIRVDVPDSGDLEQLAAQFVGEATVPYVDFLLHDPTRARPLLDAMQAVGLADMRTSIEVFNEPPGKDQVDEDGYIRGVLDVWELCAARDYAGRVIAGAQGNLSREAMRWYRHTVPDLPETITVAFHDYPFGLQVDDEPWPPASSHQDALDRLRAITGPRPLVCSEVGRHMAIELTGHPPYEIRLTEQWIYVFLIERLRLYAGNGVEWAAVYQWADDPRYPDLSEGLYGIHGVAESGLSGPRKQQAYALADWRRGRLRRPFPPDI